MHAIVFIINGECDMAVGLTFKDNTGTNVQADTIKSIVYEDDAQNKYTFGVDSANNIFNTFKYEDHGTAEVDYSATATKFMTGGAVAALLSIETNVDEIKAKTDNMPADLKTELTTITTETNKIADIKTNVGDIKAKTDNMPADLKTELTTITTDTGKITAIGAKVDKIETKTDNIPDNLVNELASLAKSVDVNAIKTDTGKIADIGTNVGDIKAKTDNMPNNLKTELVNLTTIGKAISNNTLDQTAKLTLQTTFDNAIKKAIDDPQFTIDVQPILQKNFKEAVEKAGGTSAHIWFNNHVIDIMSKPTFEIPTSDDAALNWTW
ncbi:hypothetical protein [Wolbachia endosymbiont of Zygogramma bicolorata]|uniref:hypothetical protein n=1 Tax=Wolbachia endosymbiont of Zygogramma bicolorata TaxID=3134048 RepID=UPI003DA84559